MRVQYLARSSGLVAAQAGEGGAGGLGGGVDVGGVAVGDAADHLAVGGVEHVDRARALRTAPRRRRCRSCRARTHVAPCGGSGRTHGPVSHRRYRRVRRLRTPSLERRLGYRPAMTEPQDPGPRSDEVSLRIEAPPERRVRHRHRHRADGPAQPRVHRRAVAGRRHRPGGRRPLQGQQQAGRSPAGPPPTRSSRPSRGGCSASRPSRAAPGGPTGFEPDGDGTLVTESRGDVQGPSAARQGLRHAAPRRHRRTTTTRCATACARPSSASRPSPSHPDESVA